eukprot:974525-Pyramimonas_sp.AAC.1
MRRTMTMTMLLLLLLLLMMMMMVMMMMMMAQPLQAPDPQELTSPLKQSSNVRFPLRDSPRTSFVKGEYALRAEPFHAPERIERAG